MHIIFCTADMADLLKQGDFVELDYTGRLVEDNVVFDTTLTEIAKKNGLNTSSKYEPIKICIGKKHVISGLDKNLVGKETAKKYVFRIQPEDGFGEKNPKLIQLVATSKFRQQQIMPMPGLQVNMDGLLGTIRTVSGGRTIVDFNHPLAGKELEYEVEVKRIITDVTEKIDAALSLLGVTLEKTLAGQTLTLKTLADLPNESQEQLSKAIKELVPEITTISFEKNAASTPSTKTA